MGENPPGYPRGPNYVVPVVAATTAAAAAAVAAAVAAGICKD